MKKNRRAVPPGPSAPAPAAIVSGPQSEKFMIEPHPLGVDAVEFNLGRTWLCGNPGCPFKPHLEAGYFKIKRAEIRRLIAELEKFAPPVAASSPSPPPQMPTAGLPTAGALSTDAIKALELIGSGKFKLVESTQVGKFEAPV